MTFAIPIFAGAAAFIIVPIVIHMIERQRFQPIELPTMRFLARTQKRNIIRLSLIDVFLLILRVLAVALIAMAFANPLLPSGNFGMPLPTDALIILDDSPSMARNGADGTPLIESAKGAAASILDSLPEGGNSSIVAMSGVKAPVFTLDRGIVKANLEDIQITPSPSRAIEAALAGLSLMAPKKADVLGVKAGESRRKEIFFITDMCSNSFGGDLSDLAQALKRPEGDSSIGAPNAYVIDVGEASTANIAVRAVRISRGKVSIETPLRIALEVVNYGTKAVKDIAVEMKMEDKPVGQYGEDATKITLQPGEVRLVEFPYTPYRSGILTGQASITSKEKNAVTWDDHYFFSLEVRESISVLCIDGDESGRGAESDAFRRAIIASAPGQGHPLFTTRFVNASKSADQVLAFYDVVAMINPGVIPADTVQAAVEFVEHGGGLVIFLGDLVKAEAFQGLANAVLPDAAEEEKFLPIAIAETIDALKLTGAPVRLAHCDFSLPLFRPFRDPANGDPTALAAYRFRKMIFAEDAPVTTVASFSDGSPAIVERKFGRGKVIIVATTPNKRWTNFPTSPVFLTFARAMVGAARRGDASSAARYYFSGDVFQITTKAERLKRGTDVVQPGGQPLLSRVIDSDFERRILGRAGQASGIYKVMLEIDAEDMEGEAGEKLTFRPVDSFAVNLPPSESSLSRLNAKGMTKEMGGNVQVVALEEGWVGAISSERQGRQLGWYAFVALLVLLTLEGFVAWLKKTTEVRQGATAK